MPIKSATSKRLMGLLVVVLLLFAIGASGQQLDSEPQKNSVARVESLVKVLEGTESAIFVDQMLPDSVKYHAMSWALSKRHQVTYSPQQVADAIQIHEETPLSFESSLYLAYYCEEYEVSQALVLSIIEVESRFDQHAVGKSKDRGYMQIIPSTEKWLARSYGKELGLSYDPQQIFDPEYNLGLAIRYISDLESKYGKNAHRVLSEYNRGSVRLANYFRDNQTYQTSYSRSIIRRMDKYDFDNVTSEAPLN